MTFEEKIKNRLITLNEEYRNLTSDRIWITDGSSRRERINICKILIDELNNILNDKK